jgi:hypothetical protein
MTIEPNFTADDAGADNPWPFFLSWLTELREWAVTLSVDADDAELDDYLEEHEAFAFALHETPATTAFARRVVVLAGKLGFTTTDTLERALEADSHPSPPTPLSRAA